FLMAVAPVTGRGRLDLVGVALLDLSTGEFSAAEYTGADGMQALADELAVLKPRELLVPSLDEGRGPARHAGRPLPSPPPPPRWPRPARSSTTCAPPRRSISRTSARLPTGSA